MTSSRTNTKASGGPSACIWMQAGSVRKKYCRIDYDCTACRFDRAMRRVLIKNQQAAAESRVPQGKRKNIVFWKDLLNQLPAWKRPCLHHMKGRIDFRTCTQKYQCSNCEFDQYFSDQYSVHAVVRPVNVLDVKGFKLPHGYYLHRGHAWVKIEEGSSVRVGLDDFALRLLGPLDRIEAPLMGKTVEQDRGDIALHRGDKRARVLSPVSGVVTDINPNLRQAGGLASQEPYAGGWIMLLHSSSIREDLKNLMIGCQASDFLDLEVEDLYQVIEAKAGPLAADGGYLGDDIFGTMPELGWQSLTRRFLRS